MMKFRSYARIFSLMLAISFAARSEAGTVTLFPPEVGGGFAEVTAGKSVTFDLTLTNGTDDPIFTPDPSTIANGINFDVGNMDLAVTGDAIVNNTCNLPMLGAAPCSFGLKVSTADLNPELAAISETGSIEWACFTMSRQEFHLKCSRTSSPTRSPCAFSLLPPRRNRQRSSC